MQASAPADYVALLLAAGRGTRFDQQEGKLRQAFSADGASVAVHAARALLAVRPTIAVVAVVAQEDTLAASLRALGCEVVLLDPTLPREMSASLRQGLAHRPQAAGWLVALADMPLVQASTIQRVLDALRDGADIAVPVLAGKRGHPVGFSRRHRAALMDLKGDQGARAILAAHAVTEISVDDAGVAIDIDTPDDLKRHRPL